MSFAAAFYNFSVDLSHSDRGIFTRFRVKTPLHPNESLHYLFARVLSYAHCYREGQAFSGGLFVPEDPTIWQSDVTGDVLLWVQVGCPTRKKLEKSLKAWPKAEHRVYFFDPLQIHEMCHMLRGSKTNWVEGIQFFMLPSHVLESLIPLANSSPTWQATFIDNRLYLTCDGHELEGDVLAIDIWTAYQESLQRDADPPSS